MRAIFLFELRYQLRQPLFWIVATSLGLLSFGAASSDNLQIGGSIGNVLRNAPTVIVTMLGILSVFGLFTATAFVATAALRDFEHRTEAFFFTRPLRERDYLLGRFAGAMVIGWLAYVGPALGIFLAGFMPWVDPERLGPVSLTPYLWSFGVHVLPNLLFLGSVFFVVALLTRSLLATYASVIGFFVAYALSGVLLSDLESERLGALLDPFGLSTLETTLRYWTVAERNTMLPPIDGLLIANRLVWLGVGLAVLAYGVWRFDFRSAKGRRGFGRKRSRAVTEPATATTAASARTRPVDVPRFEPATGFAARWRQGLRILGFETRAILGGRVFLVILAFGLVNIVGSSGLIDSMYGTPVYPVTHLMLQVIENSYAFLLLFVLAFYAGEVVWRDRSLHLDDVVDATPVPSGVLVGAKIGALWLTGILYMAAGVAATIGVQLWHGFAQIEPGLYLRGALAEVWPFLVFAVLAVLLQVVANSKFLGFLLVVLYLAGRMVTATLGYQDRLYRIGSSPPTVYSDMNGYGHYADTLLYFGLYWALAAVVFAGLARLVWVRGRDTDWRQRLSHARRRFEGPTRALLAIGSAAFVGMGAFLYWNTHVLNDYQSADILEQLAADYEAQYKRYQDEPLPRITDVTVEVDLFPSERRMRSRGTFTLRNETGAPLESFVLNLPTGAEITHFSIDLPPHEVRVADEDLGFFIYDLEQPLEPDATLPLHFEVEVHPRGVASGLGNQQIVANGTFFNNRDYFPLFGYQPSLELQDRSIRRDHGLGELERMRSPDDPEARGDTYLSRDADWIRFETTVSTDADQVALAPGYLQKEWTEGDRRYFQYAMDAPILNFYAFLSARWDVARASWTGLVRNAGGEPNPEETVAIEVYHHPDHRWNVDRMIDAVQKSLDYYTANFSPYQHRQLRIVEFPRYANFAQAFPNTVPFSESVGFIARLDDDPDAIDYVFYVTAHEVAHQWWAHQVIGADVRGSTMLSESLAQYSALMVMEEEYGEVAMRRFLRYELDAYLRGRSEELVEEVPLVAVEDQPYIHYRKGSVVLYRLKDLIGADAVNRALAAYIDEVAYQEPPFTVAEELMEHFRRVTPPAFQDDLVDLFETITLFDNRVVDATWSETADGRYAVRIEARARKLRADGLGEETEIPVDDLIDVGVFGEPGADGEPEMLYFERLRVTDEHPVFEMVVDAEPKRAGFDPFHKLVDRVLADNTKVVSQADNVPEEETVRSGG